MMQSLSVYGDSTYGSFSVFVLKALVNICGRSGEFSPYKMFHHYQNTSEHLGDLLFVVLPY